MPAPKSHCGLDLPLDASFDFAGWRKQPADLPIPSDMDLQERNQYNCDITTENRASICVTRAYEEQLQNGNNPPTTTDIGKKLCAFYAYSSDELEKMINSEAYCAHVVAPIPPKLLQYLLEARDKRSKAAEKKKEEEKLAKEKGTGLKGSMVMSGVTKANVLTRPAVSTPETLQVAIKYKLHPSLFWFTDPRLIWATENPAELPMIKNTTINAAPEKSLLDVPKMKTVWGSDDTAEGHDVLDWTNASDNFLMALKTLCAAPDTNNPSSYAVEMKKHQDFFRAMDDFRSHFPVWYPVEKKLRNKILDNNMTFDEGYWTSQVDGVLNAWKAAKEISGGAAATIPAKMSDLAANTVAPRQQYRQQPRDGDYYRPTRDAYAPPRVSDNGWQGRNSSDNGRQGRDSFRDRGRDTQNRDSFRQGPEPSRRTVTCLVCAGDHTINDHPPAQVDFKDRTPCYAVYENRALKTARATGGEWKVICIGWNINVNGRQCNGANHPAEHLHVCSLCGAPDHAALPGNPRCRRFKNGTLNP
ncbi:hypothetical protein DFH07DRAFT_777912 [Mycena maculata]|uniref:Uncharacterized protein n=1 Tax=Mycena maculata TaxID=230809 RepID=A0AAD7IFM1_9AGAR|nr:hypothetical protein DFH07DRAFT_777912 [Mycena maculata]